MFCQSNPRPNPAENFGQAFLWQNGNVFLWHNLIFGCIYKVTISHIISGRTKSAFSIVYMSCNSVEMFFASFLLDWEASNLVFPRVCGKLCCAVLWCGHEFQCTLQLFLHSICNTWKWRFPFGDSIMIWQTASKMLKAQSWVLCGRGMRRQMATVVYAAIFYTAGIGLWETSWQQTHSSFREQLFNRLICFLTDICRNTCSQEALN